MARDVARHHPVGKSDNVVVTELGKSDCEQSCLPHRICGVRALTSVGEPIERRDWDRYRFIINETKKLSLRRGFPVGSSEVEIEKHRADSCAEA